MRSIARTLGRPILMVIYFADAVVSLSRQDGRLIRLMRSPETVGLVHSYDH